MTKIHEILIISNKYIAHTSKFLLTNRTPCTNEGNLGKAAYRNEKKFFKM